MLINGKNPSFHWHSLQKRCPTLNVATLWSKTMVNGKHRTWKLLNETCSRSYFFHNSMTDLHKFFYDGAMANWLFYSASLLKSLQLNPVEIRQYQLKKLVNNGESMKQYTGNTWNSIVIRYGGTIKPVGETQAIKRINKIPTIFWN